jgi:lycopene cyclase domain-containing protein
VRALGPYAYLAWLLAWSLPIVAGQWLAFAGFLGRTARRWLPPTLVLGAYFALADAVGIASGVWRIDGATTLGLRLGGVLPVEEALFFLLTTLMVAQTTMLFLWRFGDVPEEPWPGWRAAFGRGAAPRQGRTTCSRRTSV